MPNDQRPDNAARGMYHDWGPGGIAAAESVLRKSGCLSGERLALLLEHNSTDSLPPALHAYLLRFLRGQVTQKRGRKPRAGMDHFHVHYGAALYEKSLRVLSKLRTRQQAQARRRQEILPKTLDPPHILAAKYVQAHVGAFRHMEPQAFLNLLSKQRLLPTAYPKRCRHESRP